MDGEEDANTSNNWEPIAIDFDYLKPYIIYGIVMYVFITLFALFIDLTLSTSWVLINMIFGFTILLSETVRKYYLQLLKGFLEPKMLAYAMVNLGLIYSAVLLPSLIFGSSGTGSSGTNPFVSNSIFLLFMLPLVPLFADAETKLFQGLIIKRFHSMSLVVCRTCGRKSLSMMKCDMCQSDLLATPAKSIWAYLPAILVSGFIFGLAHVILIGTLYPIILTLGGIFLGLLYVREGSLAVAKVHMLYNYMVMTIIILGVIV